MMIIRLSIKYDRGVKVNDAEDIGLDEEPTRTKDGGIVRGVGTHFISEEAHQLAKERAREDNRIRIAFRNRFLFTPLDGIYMVNRVGEAQEFLQTMKIRSDLEVRVIEFNLTSTRMDEKDVLDWSKRIKNQFALVQLGRGKEADSEGLDALETLANCPAISKETADRIKEMVASVRSQKMDRLELKRSIQILDVKVDPEAMAPRRAPMVLDDAEVGK